MRAVWAVFIFASLASSPIGASAQVGHDAVSQEVIVAYRSGHEDAFSTLTRGAFGGRVARQVKSGTSVVRFAPGVSVADAAAALRRSGNILYIEPNYRVRAFAFTPNDPSAGQQYGIAQLRLPQAWDITKGSSSVVIAIVDTGVRLNHPDLVNKLVAGYDFIENDSSADDGNGHGTHCAGIAAADTNNGLGVAGTGFNSRVMPVRVLGNNGAGDVATVAQGINWAADNGAKVISLSLGGSGQSITLLNAVRYAIGKGAVVVAAAGNDGVSTPMYPGAYTEVIAVGATNAAGGRASFSNYGSWVDVAGPGALIYSTTYNGGYGLMSGTSMATPAIAGVASLVWASLGAGATPQAVRARLEDTADRTNATWVAKGIVNAQQAVQPGASGGDFEFATTTAALTAGATIRLSLSAPTLRNGASFNLTASDNAAVRVPASVRLLRNQTRLSFTARTMDVASPTPVTLTLTREGISKTVSVTINPNTLDSLIARSEVRGGGTATIAAAFGQVLAGPGSATISLSAQPTGVITLPATIVLRPGQKSVARVISTKTVTSATEVKVTATHQGVSKSTTIRVLPRS